MSIENDGYKLRIIAIVCYIAAFVGVSLRSYVRKYVVRKLGLDDRLMAAGLALYTIYISFVFVGLHYGSGQHHRDLPNENIVMAVKYWYFCEWQYVIMTTTIKYAVGIFFLRIMIQHWQILIVKTVMFAVLVFGIAYFGCVVAQCVPAPFIWRRFAIPETYQGSCLSNPVVVWGTYLHSILSASADWTLGLLPVALLWNAKMGWGTKGMMCFVLGLGAMPSTSTLVRLSVIYTIIDLDDFLWDILGTIWSTVEPGVALLAAGLATIRPLLRSLFPTLFSSAVALGNQIPSVSSISALESCSHQPEHPQSVVCIENQAPVLPHIQPLRSPPPVPVPVPYSTMQLPSPPPIPLGSDVARSGSGVWYGGKREEKGNGKTGEGGLGIGMRSGIGSGRVKSWRSITTVKSEESREIREGYGEITVVYAEGVQGEKGGNFLGNGKEREAGD